MPIRATEPLFARGQLEVHATPVPTRRSLEAVPDREWIAGPRAARGKGRDDYPVVRPWRVVPLTIAPRPSPSTPVSPRRAADLPGRGRRRRDGVAAVPRLIGVVMAVPPAFATPLEQAPRREGTVCQTRPGPVAKAPHQAEPAPAGG